MTLGVCYYPEHWPEARWAADARLMVESGLELVRIGEFAWALMEPAEGRFQWDWLDRAVDTLAAAGLQVILGTPTAAPPAWLSRNYPDTLPVDAQGRTMAFGMRRHYCANSPAYRQHTRRIVTAMAARYAPNPAVVGWQIDNEWGGGSTAYCYCPHCVAAFQAWLRDRYGTLEALNQAWGTVFWSQVYGAWEQIGTPPLVAAKANPSQVLDYRRFTSDSWRAYQQLQIDLLREQGVAADRQFITSNLMGLFSDLDYYKLGADLDFVTWDNYPTGQTDRLGKRLYLPGRPRTAHAFDVGDPAITGMAHDLMRAVKDAPFWIMEQQPGYINWGDYNPTPGPGVVRLWTWDAVAHGADVVVYFRWRAAALAQEQFHSGLLRHDGQPDRGLEEVQALRGDHDLLAAIRGTQVAAQVALLHSYDDLWALELQPHHREFDALRHLFSYYRGLMRAGVPVDLAPPERPLSPERHKLAIAPSLFLADEATVANLRRYVEAGGLLLLSVRSGFKTASNLVVQSAPPGPLTDLVGATVTSWHSLPPGAEARLALDHLPGRSFSVPVWAEALAPGSAVPLALFGEGDLAGSVAATLHRVGLGAVVYLGAWADDDLADALLAWLLPSAGVARLADLPDGVSAMRRTGGGQDFLFLLNSLDSPATATVHATGYVDAHSGLPLAATVPLPARSALVARRDSLP